jgi:hypothetical protein
MEQVTRHPQKQAMIKVIVQLMVERLRQAGVWWLIPQLRHSTKIKLGSPSSSMEEGIRDPLVVNLKERFLPAFQKCNILSF